MNAISSSGDATAVQHAAASSPLSLQQQLVYALPNVGMVYLFSAMGVIQGIYAKYFGLALTTIATVLLISRLFDAVTDPIIGYLSDRCQTRYGSRKGFIACGGVLMIVSAYFLYVPISPSLVSATTEVSGNYFLICFLAFYLSYTLFEIPHNTVGSELAKSANEKSSIFAIRTFSIYLGTFLFFIVPMLPFFETSNITPETLQWSVFVGAILILPSLYYGLKATPDSPPLLEQKNRVSQHRISLAMIWKNTPLLLFFVIFLFGSLALGVYMSMQFIFIDVYLDMGESYAAVYLTSVAVGATGLKFWHWMAIRLGKRLAWGLGMGLMAVGLLIFSTFERGEVSHIQLVLVLILINFSVATNMMVPPAMMSEIIDYSRWKYKTSCDASLFSLYVFFAKASLALGGSVGFFIAGWYGFDAQATVHTPESVVGLYWVVSWLPALLLMVSIVFICMAPISERRHGIVRRRLDGTVQRLNTIQG